MWGNSMNLFPAWFEGIALEGSVIFVIWLQVLFGVCYSVTVVSFHKYSGYPIPDFPASFITVLGLVIGLLLVFRTTTGYDRYYEGRKLWSDMTYRIRTLARCTWLGVKDEGLPENLIEKRTAINLLIAFAYATKNYLRGEYSYDEDGEIRRLTLHLPRIQQETKENGLDSSSEAKGKLSIEERLGSKGSKLHAHDTVTPTNIPMELVYYFQTWVNKVVKEEKVDMPTSVVILNFTNELMNILAQLERILRTPIPLAYSIHLHQSIWLYLLALPFQIVSQLGWITVPGMALAYFALLGILAIGGQIENPFGYDDNDLPLDEFCEVIQHEVTKFAKQKFPPPDTWIFNKLNVPFGTQSQLSALDLRSIGETQFHSHFLNRFRVDKQLTKDSVEKISEGN